MSYDLVVRNGRILDGSGNPWFKADVAIKGGEIVEVGRVVRGAEQVIDAKQMAVSPGFIDMHTHSDTTIPFSPLCESSIRQGVTTLVIGNCGMSLAPLSSDPNRRKATIQHFVAFTPIEEELKAPWNTVAEYFSHMEKTGVACNVAGLVGHGTVRIYVMGFEDREPSESEIEEMRRQVDEAMEAGAFGMSSGLIYPPGMFSKTEELIELSKVVTRYRGIHSVHMRDEGDHVVESVKEVIRIAEESKVPVHISHHKAIGKMNWGRTKETLPMIEAARERGVDITFDMYPYVMTGTGLISVLPKWVHEGGLEKLLERLRGPATREKIRVEMEGEHGERAHLVNRVGWDRIYIEYIQEGSGNKDAEGKNLIEIGRMRGKTPFNTLCDLLIEEKGKARVNTFGMDEEEVRGVIRHPLCMIGSDGRSVAPYGVLGKGRFHPRYYGTFTRVLGHYARDEGVLGLEEAVRKMTSFPAQRLGLRDRGMLREGFWADITIFDPHTVIDRADFENPARYPEGIAYVIVNGTVVVENGNHTKALPGRVLRHEA